jgi:DNA-binding FadR family transcriptional regulator
MTMSMRAYMELGQAIVTGAYDHKPLPSESDLCEEYGASRTVIREAIKLLTAKGLIFTRQRFGTRVNPVAEWDLLDPDVSTWLSLRPPSKRMCLEFAHMRLAIEPVAASLAARCNDPELIGDIERRYDEMARFENVPEKLRAADVAFHIAILRAAENDVFWRLHAFIKAALEMSIGVSQRAGGISLGYHHDLLKAIVGRHPDDAEQHARRLLQNAIRMIEAHTWDVSVRAR